MASGLLLAYPACAVRPSPPSQSTDPLQFALPDQSMVDQQGRAVKFASEAVGDAVVAINFVFTACTTSCPLTSSVFNRVQTQLKGKPARLITVSLDPQRDTPERLKAYADRFKAGPGWLWLTGQPADVGQVLKALGAYVPDVTQHSAQVLVGSAKAGWTRFNTLPAPDLIVSSIYSYLRALRHD